MSRRSPQEKKALSYARDCRYNYGENNKSSRRSIRRNKRFPHQANRHQDHLTLAALTGTPDPLLDEAAEVRLHRREWRHDGRTYQGHQPAPERSHPVRRPHRAALDCHWHRCTERWQDRGRLEQ